MPPPPPPTTVRYNTEEAPVRLDKATVCDWEMTNGFMLLKG